MDLKTTTRPGRNAGGFRDLRGLLKPTTGAPVAVLEAGPGLAVKYLGRMGGLLQLVERLARRLPLPDSSYESYETAELLSSLDGLDIRLTLLDINPRPLKVIADRMPGARIRTQVADLGLPSPAVLAPLMGTFDLVVAMHLVGRISDAGERRNAQANLRALAKPGGLIFANQADLLAPDCMRVDWLTDVYRKTG